MGGIEDFQDIVARKSLLVETDGTPERIIYQDPHSIDEILSRDVARLSFRERTKHDEELHGVTNLAPRETPEFLEDSLRELSVELGNIPEDDAAAYIESQVLPTTYVDTPEFRLKFLRCELFDAKQAAYKMVRFLDLARDLYGPVVLERPLRLEDLTRDEVAYMGNGSLHVLPLRDRSGRPVYVLRRHPTLRDEANYLMRERVAFYVYSTVIDDVESQQKGSVMIVYASEKEQRKSTKAALPRWEGFSRLYGLILTIPIRFVAAHFCVPPTPFYQGIRAAYSMFAVLTSWNNAKIKVHLGREIEQLYSLKTYGIPVEVLPVEGRQVKSFLKRSMPGRKLLEETHDASIILYPGSNDVLFQKGPSLASHPGNSVYLGYIESKIHEHSRATQTEKKAITTSILHAVWNQGGRFLEWNNKGWWVELRDRSRIYKKVANQVKLFKLRPGVEHAKMRSDTSLFENQNHAKAKRRKLVVQDGSDSESSSSCDCACFS